jgi:flagellar hook assembly protein FlgD
VGIELNPEIETKSEFSIIAYPNPFVNKVKFVLNKTPSPNSKAKIYDNTGREVRTLLVNPLSTVLIWDGKDNEGLEVKSGVYFLRLGDSKNQSITKVLLIR